MLDDDRVQETMQKFIVRMLDLHPELLESQGHRIFKYIGQATEEKIKERIRVRTHGITTGGR